MSDLPGVDLDALASWLDREQPGLRRGALSGEVIAGGKSNLTYTVSDGSNEWIVRRPPLGHVLATAHDMGREYRVMTALQGTDVPVPVTYAMCEDTEVIGAPFYVMERCVGTPYRRKQELIALGEDRTLVISERLMDTMIALHLVDPASVGLSDFGNAEGYLARQVERARGAVERHRVSLHSCHGKSVLIACQAVVCFRRHLLPALSRSGNNC